MACTVRLLLDILHGIPLCFSLTLFSSPQDFRRAWIPPQRKHLLWCAPSPNPCPVFICPQLFELATDWLPLLGATGYRVPNQQQQNHISSAQELEGGAPQSAGPGRRGVARATYARSKRLVWHTPLCPPSSPNTSTFLPDLTDIPHCSNAATKRED
eukprot:689757-Rhodomonas_salina.1